MGGRSAEGGGFGGLAGGRAVEDGGASPVHAKSWATYRSSSATFTIHYTNTSTSRAGYSCEYEYNCLSLYVYA
jgi:hypothetical protein